MTAAFDDQSVLADDNRPRTPGVDDLERSEYRNFDADLRQFAG